MAQNTPALLASDPSGAAPSAESVSEGDGKVSRCIHPVSSAAISNTVQVLDLSQTVPSTKLEPNRGAAISGEVHPENGRSARLNERDDRLKDQKANNSFLYKNTPQSGAGSDSTNLTFKPMSLEELMSNFQAPGNNPTFKKLNSYDLPNHFYNLATERGTPYFPKQDVPARDAGQILPSDASSRPLHNVKKMPVNCSEGDGASVAGLKPDAAETESLRSQIGILRQNHESTLQQLLQKEAENEVLRKEAMQHSEKELRLERECERLRVHLIETEDRYTREAIEAEEREEQLTKALAALKERAASSSTDILNAKSSAAKQADGLRSQLNSVTDQRDEALKKLSEAQETISGYSSSLRNLQMVLEQFQDERQQQQSVELEKCRRELERVQQSNEQLQATIDDQQVKLDGLSSSVVKVQHLSDQIRQHEEQIAALQTDVLSREAELSEAKASLERLSAVSEDRIDRLLVKNLLLGFIHSPFTKRKEAFQVVGHILGFTDEELKEIGVSSSGRWVTGLFHQATPNSSSPKLGQTERSFFELFVQFLEKESTPLPAAQLPAERTANELQEKHSHKTSLPFSEPATPPIATGNTLPASAGSSQSDSTRSVLLSTSPAPQPISQNRISDFGTASVEQHRTVASSVLFTDALDTAPQQTPCTSAADTEFKRT